MDTRVPGAARGHVSRASLPMPQELHDRVGQMIMVGFRGVTPVEAQPTIRNIAAGSIGALVLFDRDVETGGRRNIQSREHLRELTDALKGVGDIPVLVAVDAEGGSYHRLRERYGFSPAVSAAEMGERNDLAFTRMAAGRVAADLADAGIDMNLAPVLDLFDRADMMVSASRRSFSSDPALVAAHAREFILAHHEQGVLIVTKHFPGMGGILRPYWSGVGELTQHWSTAELEPYRSLVTEGLIDAVLATRVTHPELDPDFPGCLSKKVVEGILRREIGFEGVVISDAMEMLAIWDAHGFERGTILAVNAGVDLLLYCNQSATVPYSDDRGPEAVQVILDAVARGEIAEERVDQACARILALKSRLLS
jgi:beta-N-acetylhexosaminidase